MNLNWRQVELGEVITLQRGYDLTETNRRRGPVPVVTSSGVGGWHDEARACGPGVVTGRYGTLGEVFFISGDFWPHNTTLFVKDFHGNSPRFVYYLLKNTNLAKHNSATGVPGLNRNDLHKLRVTMPTVPAQEAVAEVLGSLDDNIDCNRRTNDLLLRIARLLFQHWFVDFGPFQKLGLQESAIGPIPQGWSVRSLYEAATYLNGAAFKEHDFAPCGSGLPVIKISELKGGITDQTRWCERELDPRFRIADGDILFSWSGSPETSIDIFLWAAGAGWLNQHTFRVVPHRPIERPFVFSLLKHLKPVFVRLASNKQTTGLGHVTAGDMKRLPVLVPPDSVLAQFNECAGPWLDQILANLKENQILARTRDYLLPRLLSGEVEVKELEGAA